MKWFSLLIKTSKIQFDISNIQDEGVLTYHEDTKVNEKVNFKYLKFLMRMNLFLGKILLQKLSDEFLLQATRELSDVEVIPVFVPLKKLAKLVTVPRCSNFIISSFCNNII